MNTAAAAAFVAYPTKNRKSAFFHYQRRRLETTRVQAERIVVNVDEALSATRCVSSAHLQNFRSSGSIVLRRVWNSDTTTTTTTTTTTSSSDIRTDNNQDFILSAAAGIACRLLECPAVAVKVPESSHGTEHSKNGNYVNLFMPKTLEEAASIQGRIPDSVDLVVGDVWAEFSNDAIIENIENIDFLCTFFSFEAVDGSNPLAIFVDPFYNARGETPTTVIQWSKGTIF